MVPALMTPSALVYSKQLITSLRYCMFPLAKTGTETFSLTAFI